MSDWFRPWDDCLEGNVATMNCAGIVFQNILGALWLFIGLTTLVMFMLGGYKIINAAGDPKKFQSGKSNITYGLLGISVVVLAYLIMGIISAVTGVPCILKFGFGC